MRFQAGRIVLVDWRDALPREANNGRPAVVVEDEDLFDETYPNVILVPLAEDTHLTIADLSVRIEPTPENGCAKTCHALVHHVTATSKTRLLRDTGSWITDAELGRISSSGRALDRCRSLTAHRPPASQGEPPPQVRAAASASRAATSAAAASAAAAASLGPSA